MATFESWGAIAHVRPDLIPTWYAGLQWICYDCHFLLNCHDELGEIPSRMQVFRSKRRGGSSKALPPTIPDDIIPAQCVIGSL